MVYGLAYYPKKLQKDLNGDKFQGMLFAEIIHLINLNTFIF